jgi:probable F420-dependent oxidoreductase
MALGCFISVGRSLDQAVERVRLAESLGYESVWVTQLAGRDALTVITVYALGTERIRLGTGVVPIYTRTPVTMAQTAATIDELSGGRLNLGLGVSHRPVIEGWHGQTIERPVAEMREYVGIVRAILRGEDPPAGTRWQTGFHLVGLDPRPELPIYLAGLSPGMLRLAGEVADGLVLWLCTPEYIERTVVPAVSEGLERRDGDAGLEDFDVVAAVPAAVTDDVEAVRDLMRSELLPYFGLPFYRAMIERSGYGEEIAAFDAAAGDVDGMRAAISERFLSDLAAIGSEEDVRQGIARYRGAGARTPGVGPIARTDFDAALRAAAGAGAGTEGGGAPSELTRH